MKITQLDLFSGIGGFHLGFERAGYKVKTFFSEIDKHAIAVYKHQFPKSTYVGSVTDVRGGDLPRIDLITFGSPCQDFSLAGKRKGMEGDRSSLVLEAIRLIGECRPRVFIWENVKGTFSSNNGEDFAAILQAFTNIGGYRLEWQLLNTSWFLPQNRERIYLVGYSTEPKRNWRGVFPIPISTEQNPQLQRQQANACTLTTRYGADGNGSYITERQQYAQVVDKRGNYKNEDQASTLVAGYYKLPSDADYLKVKQIGTSLDSNGGTQPYQQDRVYDAEGLAPALNQGKSDLIIKAGTWRTHKDGEGFREVQSGDCPTIPARAREDGSGQPVVAIYDDYNSKIRTDGNVGTLTGNVGSTAPRNGQKVIEPNYSSKSLNETIQNSDLQQGEPKALDLYNRKAKDESPTLTEPHHNSLRMFDGYKIRRLTPIECERLQGFPDDHTLYGNYDGEVKVMSNTQRYKQCGNAVTVDVVCAVAHQCKPLFK